MAKPKAADDQGTCHWFWIWVVPGKRGKWVRVPPGLLVGNKCKKGGKCVDPNDLGIKGEYQFQHLIMTCKKRRHVDECVDDFCLYEHNGKQWVTQEDNCSASCQCDDPNRIAAALKAKGLRPLGIKLITWCIPRH